jgi:hypothetical protein
MTNLELADALQADFPGYEVVDVVAAVLRNLHTENTALRVTEDNLRQELQECQDQRRAAFRRIEELDAMQASVVQQEPVAWMVMNGACSYQLCGSEKSAIHLRDELQKRHDLSGSLAAFHVRPLVYGDTHPARQDKPQPLTEQELKAGRESVTDDPDERPDPWSFRMGVWFAERHHGIKE